MVLKDSFFPSNIIRKCTLDLKVTPQLKYIDELRLEKKKKPVSAVGIRKEESQARSVLGEFEEKDESTIWRPLIDWDFQQIVDIHKKHNVAPNPLYTRGYSRVGCFPCIFARKGEIEKIYKEDPQRFDVIRDLEKRVKETALAKGKPERDYTFFRRGKVDDVIAWALEDDHGQTSLLDEEFLSGCLTWGLCDSGLTRKLISEQEYEDLSN